MTFFNKKTKSIFLSFLAFIFILTGCSTVTEVKDTDTTTVQETVVEGEAYYALQDVVDYLDLYDELPVNYLTKDEARDLGWESSEGNLWEVSPGSVIGGDYFGNYEGLLPEESDRDYYEADINYEGGYRNAERLVFSNDGLYFYTEDHYESFDQVEPGGE